jgi:hypothetical protein
MCSESRHDYDNYGIGATNDIVIVADDKKKHITIYHR